MGAVDVRIPSPFCGQLTKSGCSTDGGGSTGGAAVYLSFAPRVAHQSRNEHGTFVRMSVLYTPPSLVPSPSADIEIGDRKVVRAEVHEGSGVFEPCGCRPLTRERIT